MSKYRCKKYGQTELFARTILAMNGCTNLFTVETFHHGARRRVVSGVSLLDEHTYMIIVDDRGIDDPATVKLYQYRTVQRMHMKPLNHE